MYTLFYILINIYINNYIYHRGYLHCTKNSRSSKPAPTPISIMLVTDLVIINLRPHIGRLIIASINHIMIRLLIIMLLVNIAA